MSQTTPRLTLPYIQPAQAQKHVTHNEALRALDLLVQLSFIDDSLTAPPAAPGEGECYIVPTGGTGDWSSKDGQIAAYLDGQWQFTSPRAGWRGLVLSRSAMVIFDGTSWQNMQLGLMQDATLLGLGMTATSTTPFSAKLNTALWTALYNADGGTGDIMQTLNKENANADAGFVFQEDFQTRALVGLFGDSDFRLSVSQDGANFKDGMRIDPTSGIASFANLPRFKGYTNFDNYIPGNSWTVVNINSAEYNDQSLLDPSTGLVTVPVDGTYMLGATLKYKKDASDSSLSIRLRQNGTNTIRGSEGREAGVHDDTHTSIWCQTLAVLNAGDTVGLEAFGPSAMYLKSDDTVFWGYKVG